MGVMSPKETQMANVGDKKTAYRPTNKSTNPPTWMGVSGRGGKISQSDQLNKALGLQQGYGSGAYGTGLAMDNPDARISQQIDPSTGRPAGRAAVYERTSQARDTGSVSDRTSTNIFRPSSGGDVYQSVSNSRGGRFWQKDMGAPVYSPFSAGQPTLPGYPNGDLTAVQPGNTPYVGTGGPRWWPTMMPTTAPSPTAAPTPNMGGGGGGGGGGGFGTRYGGGWGGGGGGYSGYSNNYPEWLQALMGLYSLQWNG
jgi:hypothetical protein